LTENQLRSFFNNSSDLTVCVSKNRTAMDTIFWNNLIQRSLISMKFHR